MKAISIKRRAEALDALEATRAAQAKFWKCLRELERVTQTELISTIDYREVELDTLLKRIRQDF
jgi:hypothetical protein